MGGAGHGLVSKSRSARFPQRFYSLSSTQLKLFWRSRGYIGRPTHDRLTTLRQVSWIPREGNTEGGGKTWPASLFSIFPRNCPDANFSQRLLGPNPFIFKVKRDATWISCSRDFRWPRMRGRCSS